MTEGGVFLRAGGGVHALESWCLPFKRNQTVVLRFGDNSPSYCGQTFPMTR